jgi:hypothetical protein
MASEQEASEQEESQKEIGPSGHAFMRINDGNQILMNR